MKKIFFFALNSQSPASPFDLRKCTELSVPEIFFFFMFKCLRERAKSKLPWKKKQWKLFKQYRIFAYTKWCQNDLQKQRQWNNLFLLCTSSSCLYFSSHLTDFVHYTNTWRASVCGIMEKNNFFLTFGGITLTQHRSLWFIHTFLLLTKFLK